MTSKPELKQIGALLYQCSACDFKIDLDPQKGVNPGERQKRLDTYLAEHIRECHSEDVNQAAARIVRQATEGD